MRRALKRIFGHPLTISILVVAALAAGCLAAWQQWTARLLRQGEQALAAREYADAREHLARYLAARPGDAHARLLAARAARRLHKYDEASEHLHRCLADGGPAETVAVEYGLLAVQQGEEGPVAALRQRARDEDELALEILETLIQYDLDTYRLRLALHELNAYLRQRPDDLQALLTRAFVWERFQSYADALEDYRKAVEAHPHNERARLRLGETLLTVGTPGEALEHYHWLAQRWPERPDVRLGLARCRRQLGQTDEAQQLLNALLTESPDDGQALWERGQLALEQNGPAEAEPWLRRAVRARPHDRHVSYSLYRCLLELGRRPEAEAVKARVDQIDADLHRLARLSQEVLERPDDAALRCEGGLLFLRNGERQEGLRWLRLALRLDPRCEAARAALADAESRRRP